MNKEIDEVCKLIKESYPERDDFCERIKRNYPDIAKKADQEYLRLYDDFDDKDLYSYAWFETLANAINYEMTNEVTACTHSNLFNDISKEFTKGNEDVQKCIDVAFVENLFWRIPSEKAEPYWSIFPENLKKLYIEFHRKPPV